MSDHCLLSFSFNFDKCNEREATENVYERVTGKFVWNNAFKPEYIGLLQRPEITEKLTALNSKIPNCTERVEANTYLLELSSILENVASPLFKATSNKTNTNSTERCFDEKKTRIPGITSNVLRRNTIFSSPEPKAHR